MDKLVSKLQKFSKTKRGITLIQIFFVVVAIIALSAIFNPIDLFNKATRGRETSGWVTDLSSVQNNILASKSKSDLLFGVTVENNNPKYSLTVTAPPASAYEDTRKIEFEKNGVAGGNTDRVLTYSKDNSVTYSDTGTVTLNAPTLKDYKGKTAPNTKVIGMTGFAYSGSDGIAPFVNINISDIEEDLFYGLMGAEGTTIGDEMAKTDKSATIANKTIKDFLTLTFGENTVANTFNRTKDTADRWVEVTPIRQDALEELVGGNSRFYDENKYRLYLVTDVVPLSSAYAIADTLFNIDSDPANKDGDTTVNEKQTKAIEELYNKLTNNISEDGILVVPNENSNVVYSESSDFKRIKFGTAD